MKKVLIILLLFIGMPSFALCPIGDGESVCTLPNSSSSIPLFQTNDISNPNSPQSQLQNRNNTNSFGRTRNKEGIQMQGSLGCQFGNCNNEQNSIFLPNQ